MDTFYAVIVTIYFLSQSYLGVSLVFNSFVFNMKFSIKFSTKYRNINIAMHELFKVYFLVLCRFSLIRYHAKYDA